MGLQLQITYTGAISKAFHTYGLQLWDPLYWYWATLEWDISEPYYSTGITYFELMLDFVASTHTYPKAMAVNNVITVQGMVTAFSAATANMHGLIYKTGKVPAHKYLHKGSGGNTIKYLNEDLLGNRTGLSKRPILKHESYVRRT